MLASRHEAYQLLQQMGAPARLIQHARFVSEASDLLLREMHVLCVPLNALIVELGVVLHDAGKIVHPEELAQPGSLHEVAGEQLLLRHGVQPEIACCCRTHGAWSDTDLSLEERIVALADKLWKGKREADLELLVIDEVAARVGVLRWEIFERLDSAFEKIAVDGSNRVEQSRQRDQ